MDVTRLGSLSVLGDYQRINQRLSSTLERISSGENAPTPKSDPVLWGDVQQLRQFAETLSGISDNLNRGAASVRVALDSMEASRQHLLQLEEKLNAAFAAPPGSEERTRNLKAYNELHVLVNDMARAPDAGARRLLDDPEVFHSAGDLKVRAGEGGFSLRLRSQEIHTGATGLDLPRVGEARPSELVANPAAPPAIADINNATNEEIGTMIEYLENAKAALTSKAKALAVDSKAIEDADVFNSSLILRNENLASDINVPDLNAESVLYNSLAARSQLAISGLAGLNETHRMVLQLIE